MAYLDLLLGLTARYSQLEETDAPGMFWAEIPKNMPAIWQMDTTDMVSSIPSVLKVKLHVSLSHSPSFRSPDLSESLYSKDRFWS